MVSHYLVSLPLPAARFPKGSACCAGHLPLRQTLNRVDFSGRAGPSFQNERCFLLGQLLEKRGTT